MELGYRPGAQAVRYDLLHQSIVLFCDRLVSFLGATASPNCGNTAKYRLSYLYNGVCTIKTTV